MRNPLASPGSPPCQVLRLPAPSIAALLLATAPLALAQTQSTGVANAGVHQVVATEGYDLDWPSSLGSGAFTAGCVVKTLDGAHPDAFIVRGGTLVQLAEAGQFDSFQSIATQVADVTRVPGAGQMGGTDGVAFVGLSGIYFGSVSPSDALLDLVPIAPGNLAGVQVRSADVDGDGKSEIVVLRSDASTFEFYGEAAGSWSLVGSLSLPGLTIGDFDLARIDGKPGHDLVLGVSDGSEAYGLAWPGPVATKLLSRNAPGFTENHVETLENHMGPGQDGFVWATRIPALGRWAVLAASAAGQQQAMILQTGDEIVGMAAGHLNSQMDSDEDLVLSLEDASRVYGFLNLSNQLSQSAFSLDANSFSTDTGVAGFNGEAPPIVGDLDGSGLADLLIGNAALESVVIHYDIDTVSYDPANSIASGGISWEMVAEQIQVNWQLSGTHPNNNFPDFAVLSAEVEATQGLGNVNAALWGKPSGTNFFLADAIASCVPVQAELLTGANYLIHEPIDTSSLGFQLNGVQNLYVLELQPPAATNGVLPQPLRMGLGVRLDSAGHPGQSGILGSSSLRVSQGLGIDDLGQVKYTSSGINGADIIVEIVPVRRLKTPPGIPPRKPATDCPDVPADPD